MVGRCDFWIIYASVKSSCVQPPWATAGHLPALSVPGVGHLQILCCPGPGHFANPELLTRTWFPIRITHLFWELRSVITTQRILLEKQADWLIVKDGKKLKRTVKACSRFYACISSLLTKPELHSETRELSTWINVFMVIESSFSWYYLKNVTSYL